MKILVTGCAGFIGFHLVRDLLKNKKNKIYGLDNLNSYYDINLKKKRLEILKKNKNFFFYKIDLEDKENLKKIFKKNFNIVFNLAAQAGVRYSIFNPKIYFNSNIKGFFNILNACKENHVQHLIFASTSSVYGSNNKFPLKEDFNTDRPESFYAATKKCNEVMAYSYSSIYKLKVSCVRFFTVYGPYGRPDMSLFKFVEAIKLKKFISLFNYGNHTRDFTYIDDVVFFLKKIMKRKNKIKYETFNISSSNPTNLKKYIQVIEKNLKLKAKIKLLKLQKR